MRITFTFDPRDMLLSLQMGFSFVRAAVACAIRERTSGLKPSSETTAPRYLKLVTVPNFCHFTFISLWMPLALFVINLVSILYLVQVLSRLSTRASSSCSSSASASMSSANRRLVMFLPPMLTFPSCCSRASDMIRSRKMLKRVGDRRHPCLTPTFVLNNFPMLQFIWTALVALSWSCSMVRTRLALILYFRMVAHKAACHTLSKAFLKSMKTWYRFCWCWKYFSHRILRLKICSVVLLPALNPACSTAIISSTCGLSLFKITFSMTLLE